MLSILGIVGILCILCMYGILCMFNMLGVLCMFGIVCCGICCVCLEFYASVFFVSFGYFGYVC